MKHYLDETGRGFLTRFLGSAMLVACALMATPVKSWAQICLGSPARDGEFTIGASLNLADDATGYRLGTGANLLGPLAVDMTVGIVDVDGATKNITSVGTGLAFELPVRSESFGACPTVGLVYSRYGEEIAGFELDLSAIQLPFALSLGARSLLDEQNQLLPSGTLGVLYTRAKATLFGESETDSNTAFFSGGLTLSVRQLYLRGGVSHVLEEGSDPSINLSAGLHF